MPNLVQMYSKNEKQTDNPAIDLNVPMNKVWNRTVVTNNLKTRVLYFDTDFFLFETDKNTYAQPF